MTTENRKAFREFPLNETLMEGIEAFGFEHATPIQEQVIPAALEGRDILGCAQTGTGKTAAFLIPLAEKLSKHKDSHIRALIIAPTRELAMQIEQNLMGLTYFTGLSCQAIYGGQQSGDFVQQKMAIQNGTDVLIATPGRLISHLNLGYLDFSHVEALILDEADRMLDMGFYGDILKILKHIPKERQNMMFSATMAPAIRKLADQLLHDPVNINLAIAKPAAGINQQAYLVYEENKLPLLERILQESEVRSMIIFVSQKSKADTLYRRLKKIEPNSASIHSDRSQTERNEALRLFKSGQYKILVATDILSRGIDIDDLSHVVNYNIPDDAADYVHRIGRTARAGKSGAAISFINPDDQRKFHFIEELIEREVEKLPTPPDIGETPEYNPKRRSRPGGRNRHNGRNRGGSGRSGGNRKGGQGKGRRPQGSGGHSSNRNRGKRPPRNSGSSSSRSSE